MKYKHHTLLPVQAFKIRGSVVGGRSMRLHGGDSMSENVMTDAEWLAYAQHMASQGYYGALNNYNAQQAALEQAARDAAAAEAQRAAQLAAEAEAAWSEARRQELLRQAEEARQIQLAQEAAARRVAEENARLQAEYQARIEAERVAEAQRQQAAQAEQQRTASIVSAYRPFDVNRHGSGTEDSAAYQNAATLANWQMERGRPDLAQQFIDQANAYIAQQDRIAQEQNALMQQYGTVPFGTGMGQALGYAYGVKNSEGDLFKKFDAQGNLTEFLDQHGQWQKASDVKPTGFQYNEDTGKYDTVYSYGGRQDITGDWVPGMSKYHEDQGGWLGEGGWGRVAGLVAAGLTAGLAANPTMLSGIGLGANAGKAVISGVASVAQGMSNGQSFGEALLNGVKTGAVSAGLSSALSSLAAPETTAGGFLGAYEDMAPGIDDSFIQSVSNPDTVFDALVSEFKNSQNISAIPGSETAALTTIGATQDQLNDLESIGIKLPQVGKNYSKWHEFADDPANMVIPEVTDQQIPFIDLTTGQSIDYGTLVNYLTDAVGGLTAQSGNAAISSDLTQQINNLLSSTDGITKFISSINSGKTPDQAIIEATGSYTSQPSAPIAPSTPAPDIINTIAEQAAKNQDFGMTREEAVNAAITGVSGRLGITEQNILDSIGLSKSDLTTQITDLGTGFGKQLGGVESRLRQQITANEAAGMSRDQALDAAIRGVSNQLGMTEQNLLNQIGVTRDQLGGQITTIGGQVEGIGEGLKGLAEGFDAYQKQALDFELKRQKQKQGEEAVNLLSQMASGSVKSGIPAEIDYFYDIGGESLFATPKQESLMPSPFEDAPEPIEGAMPRYQYYDPQGGYLYAGGGMVNDYTIDDLYRILGSK